MFNILNRKSARLQARRSMKMQSILNSAEQLEDKAMLAAFTPGDVIVDVNNTVDTTITVDSVQSTKNSGKVIYEASVQDSIVGNFDAKIIERQNGKIKIKSTSSDVRGRFKLDERGPVQGVTAEAYYSSNTKLRNPDTDKSYRISDEILVLNPSLVALPEIAVLNGATDVAVGGAVDVGATDEGTSVDTTFTIQNTGTADLTIGSITVPAGFTLTTPPASTTIAAGASETFVVTLDAAAAGTYTGDISFTTNDSDEATFTYSITGVVNPLVVNAPEIAVLNGATEVASNGSIDIGSTPVNVALPLTLTIENQGTADLTISNLSLPLGLSLVTPPDATIAAGSSSSFTVSLLSNVETLFNGDIVITSDDADEGTYTISLTGSVVAQNN